MPLPMVHLLFARELCNRYGYRLSEAFLLGSIAPDAIHVRAGSSRHDKHITHLYSAPNTIDSTAGNIAQFIAINDLDANYDKRLFIRGYAFHSMLDSSWIRDIFIPLDMELRAGGLNYDDVRGLYYYETNACDAFLFNNDEGIRACVDKMKGLNLDLKEDCCGGLLSYNEVLAWKDRVYNICQKTYSDESYKAPVYITPERIYKYIESIIECVVNKLKQNHVSLDLLKSV